MSHITHSARSDWFSDALTFSKLALKRLFGYFGYGHQLPLGQTITPSTNDANLVIAPKRKRGLRDQSKPTQKTMGDLLESLSETFKHLEFDIDGVTFDRMLKSEVAGLKKCSPLVVNKSFFDHEELLTSVDPKKGLPAFFVVAVNKGEDNDKSSTLKPDFAFGMRVRKVPWNVTRLDGTVYLFGMAWRVSGKHLWRGFWLSVRDDGSIQVADELQNKYIPIKGGAYMKRTWEKSTWDGPSEDREGCTRSCFAEALSIYQTRKEKWNVGVSNGKKRITFLIDQVHSKTYFQNRNKTVTLSGKTKPIIHFVRAHQQHHGEKVVEIPEHIRGLREFDWSGYHCTVTAPKFHAYLSSDLELSSEYINEEDWDEKSMLNIGALAEKMNRLEDAGLKRARP